MRLRSGVLLCLGMAAACSNQNTESAKDPTYVNQPQRAENDADMTPASLERERAAATPAPATPQPSTEEGVMAPSSAPLVADTRGAGTNDFKGQSEDAPATDSPAAAKPDNTKVNERDRNAAALTPGDQRENQTDLKITQQIRQALMADGSLSFTAKNVKIITASGKVTLRGPVKTEQERSAIEAAARKAAGVTQVDNQIEVKN